LIGVIRTFKRIVAANSIKDGRILGATQDGSREFISLLACISAAGKALPPALICGELHTIFRVLGLKTLKRRISYILLLRRQDGVVTPSALTGYRGCLNGIPKKRQGIGGVYFL
jgi:hypothetical protein